MISSFPFSFAHVRGASSGLSDQDILYFILWPFKKVSIEVKENWQAIYLSRVNIILIVVCSCDYLCKANDCLGQVTCYLYNRYMV